MKAIRIKKNNKVYDYVYDYCVGDKCKSRHTIEAYINGKWYTIYKSKIIVSSEKIITDLQIKILVNDLFYKKYSQCGIYEVN